MMSGLPGGCNPADVLFKLAHARGISAPVFVQVSEQGPPHDKTFSWSCSFLQGQYNSLGQGRSKKEARNASAKSLITQLDLSTLPQKPQRQAGGKSGGKRKLPSDSEQPGIKKNKGFVEGGGTNPLFGPGAGFDNNYHQHFGPADYMGVGGMGGMAGFGVGPMMGPGPMVGMGPMMEMGGYHGGMRNFQPNITVADKQVMKRHQEIYPADEELDTILMLVDTIEKALKRISDAFAKENDGGEREMMGVARVGDVAKGLLLTGDKEVNLVVMCCNKPTMPLLETITTALKKELGQEEDTMTKYEVHMFPEEGGLCVTSSELGEAEVPYQVTVTLTSTLLRKEEVKEEATPGLLPKDKGLLALAELRHSKWFSAMAANLSSCVESIRIMRDKVQRDPVWSSLGGWAIELLVERALFSAGRNLSPSSALMRIMEVVASGLLMPDGQGIKDPCEREETSVFSHMTLQMKEDVTKQAQLELRNIHYRKIHLVLGLELAMLDPNHKKEQEKSVQAVTEHKDAPSDIVNEEAT
eukprot:TRINITY_DN14465_c0_g1_i1.p1 TRINITY_DN14465_c0_g1~~TRINITY_DN14465_c0_g1_i1.p1  ORF type:complete len:526 (+),score=227.33 TRINITY_DN14465_c0_g1_i1:49-1626(+)